MSFNSFKNVSDTHIEKSESLSDENIHKHQIQNSIISIAYHPFLQNVVAVATQQCIQVYQIEQLQQSKPLLQFDIPVGLEIQKVVFITSNQYKMQWQKREVISRIPESQFEVAVIFKDKNFIHLIDLRIGHVRLIYLNSIPHDVVQYRNQFQIIFQNDNLDSDFYEMQAIQYKESENIYKESQVPDKFFIIVCQDEFYVVTCGYKLHIFATQLSKAFSKYSNSCYCSAFFLSSPDHVFIQQGPLLSRFRLKSSIQLDSYKDAQKQKTNQNLKQIQSFDDMIRLTFQPKSIANKIDSVVYIATLDFHPSFGQIFSFSVCPTFLSSQNHVAMLHSQGLEIIGFDNNNFQQPRRVASAKFGQCDDATSFILEAHFGNQAPSQEFDNVSSDQSDFDIYAKPTDNSLLSEESTNDDFDRLEHQELTQLYGFDYFARTSIIVRIIGDQRREFPLYSQLQKYPHLYTCFKQIFESYKDKGIEQTIDLKHHFQFFGQRAIWGDGWISVAQNMFDCPPIFALPQNIGQVPYCELQLLGRQNLQGRNKVDEFRAKFVHELIPGSSSLLFYSRDAQLFLAVADQ